MGTPIAPDDVTCAGRGAYGRDRGSAPGGAVRADGLHHSAPGSAAAAAVGRVPPEARRWTGTGPPAAVAPVALTARGVHESGSAGLGGAAPADAAAAANDALAVAGRAVRGERSPRMYGAADPLQEEAVDEADEAAAAFAAPSAPCRRAPLSPP